MSDVDDVQQKIDEIAAVFLSKLPYQIEKIRNLFDELGKEAASDKNKMEIIYILAHKYAGSAGSFGFDEIGRCFKNLEESLNVYAATLPLDTDDTQYKQILKLIDSADKAISERLLNNHR